MRDVVVEVSRRDYPGKNASRRLRRSGQIPGIVYGSDKEPVPVTVDPIMITNIIRSESGVNTIFRLNLSGSDKSRHVMIKDYQVDPVEGHLLHADFLRIQMDVVIEVDVPVRLVGEAVGVKVDGGILENVIREVSVSCLPADIPEHIEINITELGIGDQVSVSELGKSDRYHVLNDPSQTLVVCLPPAKEEVAAPVEEEVSEAPAEPEVIKKGKAEGEEKAEEDSK
jgi:large subunit ribosomal protein L25